MIANDASQNSGITTARPSQDKCIIGCATRTQFVARATEGEAAEIGREVTRLVRYWRRTSVGHGTSCDERDRAEVEREERRPEQHARRNRGVETREALRGVLPGLRVKKKQLQQHHFHDSTAIGESVAGRRAPTSASAGCVPSRSGRRTTAADAHSTGFGLHQLRRAIGRPVVAFGDAFRLPAATFCTVRAVRVHPGFESPVVRTVRADKPHSPIAWQTENERAFFAARCRRITASPGLMRIVRK